MRFVRGAIILILVVSLAVNVIVWAKLRGTRPIFSVNGQGFTKRDMDNYLEGQAGPAVKAKITEMMLTDQAAQKANLAPSDKDVDDEFNNQLEINWQFAMKVDADPWYADAMKKQIRETLEQQRLRTKDVPVTEDDIKTEYNSRPSYFDTPNKAKCELALIKDPKITDDVKQLMASNPPVNPPTIRERYAPNVIFIGDHDVFTFVQPFGNSRMFSQVFSMKPGEVIQLPPTADFANQGIRVMLVRLKELIPGHKADLNDPKVHEKLRVTVALRRSRPWQEVLGQLWGEAKFDSEDPNDKRYIELQFFPDRYSP